MQGQVRIQMFDKDTKKCVYDSGVKKNVITKLYRSVIEDIVKIGLYHPNSIGLSSRFSRLTPQMFSNGILLFAEPQIESVNTLYPRGKIVGYAGGEYSGTNYERGTLNTAETGPITVGGSTKGYQWVWEWTSERANGTFSAVGLCPRSIGNGQLLTPYIYGASDSDLQPLEHFSSAGEAILFDDSGACYKQHKFGYIKEVPKPVGYFETLKDSKEVIEFNLGGAWDFCSRPVLYKGKIWLIAYYNDINNPNIESGQYLLKITKDTTNIEQMWQLASYSSLVTEDTTFGLTDTHMHYVYRPSPTSSEYRIRSFNLTTSQFEAIEPLASSSYTGGTSWFSSPTFAVIMGSSSSSPNPSPGAMYADIIYPDQSVRVIPSLGNHSSMMPIGEKPYGFGYYAGYVYRYFVMLLSLFSVKNLETPQTKDSTKTMKITYTLTW